MGVGAGMLVTGQAASAQPRAETTAYLGTYTTWSGGGTGIGLAAYDQTTGQLRQTGVFPGVANPSFVIEAGRTLYAVNEQTNGAVTSIAIGAGGGLRVINSQSTGGADPCHLALDPSGRYLLSANYSSGSVAVHPVRADGGLGVRVDLAQHQGSGPDKERQEGPHAHQVLPDPVGKHLLAVDLGTDSVYSYRLDTTTGKLTVVSTAKVKPGAGPRHLAFHPSGSFAYLANELDSTIVAAAYDAERGLLTPAQTLRTTPIGTPATPRNYPAEVVVSADGRFVYLSNRGHDSVALFAVEQGGARLRFVETVPTGGKYPRHIAFDPTGRFLFAANQNSNTATTFRVDLATGRLRPTGTPLSTPIPVCVVPTRLG
ncbi:lactonase family protein [Umezawaea sp. Da 62-37]|uniref:lactonase family protein n=1 Tax=Umezawaea sp. Da 62-37 TaxID=3075927 RepID=UPI0028F700BB|nr:lactonase family protein [Umezawaea sp. Da 62-37]WNV83815.1 lactonase family protein [Umezawaea sp. Da 62-37]